MNPNYFIYNRISGALQNAYEIDIDLKILQYLY